jgi:cytochrome c5
VLARLVSLVLGASLALAACGNGDAIIGQTSAALSCPAVDASATCQTDGEAFDAILPILQKSCIPCHDTSAPDAAWPLTAYSDVEAWSGVVEGDLLKCAMPPADGGYPLTDADRLALINWMICNP